MPGDAFNKALKVMVEQSGHGIINKIAKACNVSQQHISHLSLGKRKGSEKLRRNIAKFFGYDYEAFLKLGESNKIPTKEQIKEFTFNLAKFNTLGHDWTFSQMICHC